MSQSPAPRAASVSAEARIRYRDATLLVAGAAVTVILAVVIALRPVAGLVLLAAVAFAALVLLVRHRIGRVRVVALIVAGLVSLPLLALLGPSFALPAIPQLFAFRLVLLLVCLVGVTYLIVLTEPLPFALGDVALPATLWYAWLCIGILWAPDRLLGINYIAIVTTMVALMAATAAAGSTPRRLRALSLTLAVGYGVIVGFTVLEARFGIRLPTSRLSAASSQSYAVTSVFHNQNDLATFIALCWPFLLCAFLFTRRAGWILLDLLLIALGAAAFLRTGSRSSLIAVGISSVAAAVLFSHLGSRLTTRAGKLAGALVVVALAGGAGYLLFNDSQNGMLRQFRLESLLVQAQAGEGSGAIRTGLTARGLEIAGDTYLVGAGPGQAEGIISSGGDLGISNLHNWWLETYVNGGLIGFGLHLVFVLGLVLTLWPIARRDPEPLVRYLASGTVLALLGLTVGALGPSSSVGFAPLWILYGVGLAVILRSRLTARDRVAKTAPVLGIAAAGGTRHAGEEAQA